MKNSVCAGWYRPRSADDQYFCTLLTSRTMWQSSSRSASAPVWHRCARSEVAEVPLSEDDPPPVRSAGFTPSTRARIRPTRPSPPPPIARPGPRRPRWSLICEVSRRASSLRSTAQAYPGCVKRTSSAPPIGGRKRMYGLKRGVAGVDDRFMADVSRAVPFQAALPTADLLIDVDETDAAVVLRLQGVLTSKAAVLVRLAIQQQFAAHALPVVCDL